MKQTSAKAFVDSNVLLYLNDITGSKKFKVKELVAAKPFVSVQIVFECLNVCLKKLKMFKESSIDFAKYLLRTCQVIGEEKETGIFALELFSRYLLQGYDS